MTHDMRRETPDILQRIVAAKRGEVERLKTQAPRSELERRIESPDHPRPLNMAGALMGDDVRVIAEVKKASPTKGLLRADFDPVALARVYADNGAAAVSVLTDAHHFDGRPSFLRRVRDLFSGPALRKDFLDDDPRRKATKLDDIIIDMIEEPIEHHALQGFYLVAGPGIKPGPGRAGSVVDVAPTVARFFDVSPPPDTDGASLIDFSSGTAAAKAQPPATPSANVRTPLPEAIPQTEKVSEALRERLRALGYVDE